MSSLDSKAAFKARAIELNFPEETLTKLAAINVDTFGALAFIGPLQAGTTDESPLISMLKRALGSAPDDGLLSIARRLWFESTTQALAEMRGKVERTDASEPVRMPLAERTQRLAALQKRLVGIHWTSDIEPSHKLQGLVAQMVSDQSLLWIPWDRLTSRALEITSDKTDQAVSFDSAGNLKLVKRSTEPSCSTIGEYAVKLALQRRSLAFELARVCRYEYLESWHDQLLQDTRGSLSMRSDGSYPFEASLAKWKDHTQVQCYLPLMRSPPPSPNPHTPNIPPNKDGKGGGKDKNQKALKIRKDTPGAEKPSDSGAKKWSVPQGCHSQDSTGKPLCFSFNTKGCGFAKPGKRCRRGRHLCWRRLAAEELADQLLARPTEPVPEGALLVWGLLLFQDFTCTTIAVFTNLQKQLHQDTANDSRSCNLLYPLSKFSEGDVWIESHQGKVPFEHRGEVLWGDSLPVSQGLCYLDAPNCRHATLAWKGERSILVGYTAQGPQAHPAVKPSLAVADSCKPLFVEIFAGCAPISKKARLAGAPEPVPLRDNDHILGLPNLSDTDKAWVRKANDLCRFVVELIRALPSSTFVSIENPNNSWIWGVLAFFVQESRDPALLEKWRRMIDVRFHNCMKGGRRPKHSRFRCSDSRLSSMAVECDNQHRHDPYLVYQTGRQWRFSIAEEAEYPPQLCQEVSQLLAATAGLPSCLEPPAGHALSGPNHVDAVKRNIFRRLTEGPSAFAEERLRLFNRLNQMEKELRYEEARLHSTLPDHTRELIKGKNLLLWAQLLKETKFPDEGVFDLMMGVDLVGKPDKSPLFETKESPATSTPELLLESARWRRERLKGRDPHEKDPEATWQLWDCTLKDRDDGFLTGPFYDEDEVKFEKEGGVNEAYHSLEKLALFDVNWMTAMATYIARVSDGTGALEIVLSTGEILRGELHSSWKAKKPVWQGRTLELEKAYRQVPLSTESPQSFDVGRKVTSLAPVGVQVSRSLRHVFAGKAVGTLHSRADPLIRYVAWADRHAVLAFPFKEDDMYEFACECEHTCSPSFLKSFLSAVTFCFFILGAESAQEAMASMRLSGVARACYLTKRKRVQRPPLSTEMVQRLERFVVSPDGDRIDRFIAGFFLLSIFMRARYSDTQNMYNVSEDKPQVDPSGLGGYLQADIARSKTSYTTERKTQLLPMVCPRKGIAGEDWFQAWSMLRKELNVPVGEGLPVLPAILTTGHWASHPPSASVAAGWLRNVLRKCGFSEAQCSPIGTHSCKATCLSWCARFGIDSYDQRVLGYHTAPGDRSAQVYSRDAVSASVRVLEKVLAAIRSGTFVPDSTRSGYFPTKDDPNASYDYEASSEASLDEEDAETDCQELELALDGVVDGWCEEAPKRELKAEHLVRNRSSRMLHLIADEGGTSLSCGRTCTKNYEKVANFSSRAAKLGLKAEVLQLLVDGGVNTLAKFAYVSSFIPGQSDEGPFVTSIKDLLKRDATVGELSVLRRLHSEAFALVAAELKSQVERTTDAPARSLAAPDRADRLARQVVRYPGLTIAGPNEPSDRSVDKCCQMYENNRLTYLPLSWCMSKDDETRNSRDKEDRTLTVDNSGNVHIKNADIRGEADLSTDLLLKFALTRRGLAMEQAGLLGFKEHEKWAERLLHSRYREVPSGYTRVSIQQLLQADKQLFVTAANECRSGVQVTETGRPLDGAWMRCADLTEVSHLLAPLASPPPAKIPFERPTPYGRGKGRGKGSGKGKQPSRREVTMPEDLKAIDRQQVLQGCSRLLLLLPARALLPQLPKAQYRADEVKAIDEIESISSASLDHEFKGSVEDRALTLLNNAGVVSPTDLLEIFQSLPTEASVRGDPSQGVSFSTGAYCRVKVGLRRNVLLFPNVTKLAARFVRQQLPSLKFTSLAFFRNVQTTPHVDAHNSSLPNAVCALSDFDQGQVWVERPGGQAWCDVDGELRSGVELSLNGSHAVFTARRLTHATRNWSGDRVVLVAFSVSAIDHLSETDSATLTDLEFQLPMQADILDAEQSPPVCYEAPVVTGGCATDEFPKPLGLAQPVTSPPLASSKSGLAPVADSVVSTGQVQAKPVDQPGIVLELFARAGSLSRAFHQIGFEVMPIDRGSHRLPLAKLCSLDLALPSSWQYLSHVLDNYHVRYVHIDLPYATYGPKQGLRRLSHGSVVPVGGADASQVQRLALADSLLEHAITFLKRVQQMGIAWSIEHPQSSFLWHMPAVRQLTNTTPVVYDLCAFDSPHRLRRQLLTSCSALKCLQQVCQGNHSHTPVTGGVDTHPRLFCQQVAHAVAKHCGFDPLLSPLQSSPPPVTQQRRGKLGASLIREFGRVCRCRVPQIPPVDHKNCLQHAIGDIPAGSKLLATEETGESGGFELSVGVYATPDEFLEEAKGLRHPFETFAVIPDEVKRKLHEALVKGPEWVGRQRVATLNKWLEWARELEEPESRLKEGLEPGVRSVLGSKRLLLLKRIADDLKWPDDGWFEDTCKGFGLVGWQKPTGVFRKEPRPQERTADEFTKACKYIRPALLGKVLSEGLSEHSSELWDKTLTEVAEGFLEGPLTEEELTRRYGDAWAPVRRFAVIQSSGGKRKLRPIDDYSENLVNGSFSYGDKLDLRALDEIIAICRFWIRAHTTEHQFFLDMASGPPLVGRVHPAWAGSSWCPELCTFDLKNAYRQFALNPSHRAFSVVALLNPDNGDLGLFEGKALPFGSTSSVLHFNRLSRLLWRIGLEVFLFWANFVDDYPVMSPCCLSGSTMDTLLVLSSVLGFSASLDKLNPFADVASMLGVEIDLKGAKESVIRIRNKEGRSSEVCDAIRECISEGCIKMRTFARVAGRVQFSDAQVMGRTGKLALAELRAASTRHASRFVLGPREIEAFEFLIDRLSFGSPRVVPCVVAPKPVLIFTDGASEQSGNTVGGILYSPSDARPRFFSCEVPCALADRWRQHLKHIIGPVEAYAVALARKAFHQYMSGQYCLFFVDNDAVLLSFVRGTSNSDHFRELLLTWECCEKHGCFYDDFPLLEIQSSAKLVSESFEHLLRKIGWRYSNDPAKTSPFNESFDLLGIRLNAGDISNGVVVLQNKASRLEKMKDTFIRMALNGEWDLRQIQSLQGQVNFALGFASGRALKMLQRALGSFIRNPEDRSASDFRTLCEFGIRLIDECKPRVFACRGPEQPVLIFTDAAYEKDVATFGVVVLDPFTSSKLVAGGRIPKTLVKFWKLDSPEQVIAQAEAFAVVLAREAFRNFIHGRRTIYFIDNEGAREVLIKGASKSRTLLLLGARFFEMENLDQSLTWLERVPSASNVADGPSRGEIAETAKVTGGTIVDLQEKAEELGELCKSTVQIPWKLLK
ncbi:SLC24A2 [Symbiodinium sp. CCMP2592]|nr:SLC24A2 [Symbiodinium sp. CCMP2592]